NKPTSANGVLNCLSPPLSDSFSPLFVFRSAQICAILRGSVTSNPIAAPVAVLGNGETGDGKLAGLFLQLPIIRKHKEGSLQIFTCSQNAENGTSYSLKESQIWRTLSVPPCIPTTAPDVIQRGSSGGLPIVSVKASISSVGEFPCKIAPSTLFPCIWRIAIS
ncbi:hypothetical protein V2J09_009313, partial [Rumex salicifolius]